MLVLCFHFQMAKKTFYFKVQNAKCLVGIKKLL